MPNRVGISRFESHGTQLYRVTRIIVNDFESENLYVVNFLLANFISFDRCDL